jgi:methionyl-tRNA synthetase
VHDYVTAGGRKIGKSLGNAVDPSALVDRYGADGLRWWLCREVPRVGEVDFTEDRLVDTANRDLANGVGNLVQRTVTLASRAFGADPVPCAPGDLTAAGVQARVRIDAAFARYDLKAAAEALVGLLDAANRYVERTRPWELLDDRGAARAALAPLVGVVRAIGGELEPFTPDLARRVRDRVGDEGASVHPGVPVQPRLERAG